MCPMDPRLLRPKKKLASSGIIYLVSDEGLYLLTDDGLYLVI
jgi:hypothetical protein